MNKLLDIFSFVPGWMWAAALTALLSATVVLNARLGAEQAAHARTQAAHSAQVAAAEQAARIQSENHRATEQELHRAQAVNATEVAALHLDLERARTANRVSSSRMQVAIASAAAKARTQCAAATTSGLREATDDPIDVLAHVLGRADARAGELADIAEQRGIAGRACERAYDTAREALKE